MIKTIIIGLIIIIGFQGISSKLTQIGESVSELRTELNPYALKGENNAN